MKVIVQIPVFNEEETLGLVLDSIPHQIPGVDAVETLIVDDGSTDRSVAVAREHGVDHVIRHVGNKGLAAAFRTGLDACLRLGADIIVNTDGDNQYPSESIADLVRPLLDNQADIVIGDRRTGQVAHFSRTKRLLQGLGTWVVQLTSGTAVRDAPSGFRAYSKEAALRLNVISTFSYTVETVIQAGKKYLTIAHVPIEIHPVSRRSRLMHGMWDFVKRQGSTIIRTYVLYEPLRTFSYIAFPFGAIGLVLLSRFLFFYLQNPGQTQGRYLQSVIIGGALLLLGFLIFLFGILADLVAGTRRLTEETLYHIRKLEIETEARKREGESANQRLSESARGGGEYEQAHSLDHPVDLVVNPSGRL
jgi:glycosyltransferase involved in cell wall biosynthesis